VVCGMIFFVALGVPDKIRYEVACYLIGRLESQPTEKLHLLAWRITCHQQGSWDSRESMIEHPSRRVGSLKHHLVNFSL
jgi:hypothetical protein